MTQCFFWAWKRFFAIFWVFFTGKSCASRPYFHDFSRPRFFFTPVFFSFFHGQKSRFSRAKFLKFSLLPPYSWKWYKSRRIYADQLEISKYFHGHFLDFTGVIFDFFHVHDFNFHGRKLTKFFTVKIGFFKCKLPIEKWKLQLQIFPNLPNLI